MKVLKDILYKVKLKQIIGDTDVMISNVQFDSREVGPGDVFVAVNGYSSDGHDFIDQAIKNGAIGGKVTGAGGGGYMLFYCPFEKKHQVAKALKEMGGIITEFGFEFNGLQTWRINKN